MSDKPTEREEELESLVRYHKDRARIAEAGYVQLLEGWKEVYSATVNQLRIANETISRLEKEIH